MVAPDHRHGDVPDQACKFRRSTMGELG